MHDHSHAHNHNHGHSSSRRIGWAFFLNLGFTIIEFVGGWLTNSTAILADAVHDLGDSLSMGLAWILSKLSDKHPDEIFTYGYRRLSLLGALVNSVILVLGSIWVLTHAVPRLIDPVMPVTEGMLGLAILGIVVNGAAALRLSKGTSLNERVLNWHLLEDVLGWVAVLVVAVVLMFVDWPILDPLLSIAFTLFILFNVARHLKSTLKVFFQASPDRELNLQVRNRLLELEQIDDVHHMHLWSLDGEHHVLTAHLVLNQAVTPETQVMLKEQVAEALQPFDLAHTTMELEFPDEVCRDTTPVKQPGSH